MANDQIKLFSQFGIDQRSEEQMLHDQAAQQRQDAFAREQARTQTYRGEKDLRRAGTGVGAWLKGKLDDPQLSPDQKRDLEMREYAGTSIRQKMADDAGYRTKLEANPQLAGIEMKRKMGEWAFDNGHIELAAQLSQAAGTELFEMREKEASIENMREERRGKIQDRKIKADEYHRDRDKATQILLPEADGTYDVAALDSKMVVGRWDSDRQAFVTDKGDEVTDFMTFDQAMDLRQQAIDAMDGEGVSNINDLDFASKVRLFHSSIGSSERVAMRAAHDALEAQSAIMNSIADKFDEARNQGLKPGAFLDGQGKLADITSDIADMVTTAGNTFHVAVAKGTLQERKAEKGEVQPLYGTEEFNVAYAEELAAINAPKWAETGNMAAEFQAEIVELAYAVARANEPGARQLSDSDFRHALKQLGAAAASPERLGRVMLGLFSRKANLMRDSISRAGGIATSVGLPEPWAEQNIWGGLNKSAVKTFDATIKRFEELPETLKDTNLRDQLNEAGIGIPAETQQPAETEAQQPAEAPVDPLDYFRN